MEENTPHSKASCWKAQKDWRGKLQGDPLLNACYEHKNIATVKVEYNRMDKCEIEMWALIKDLLQEHTPTQ